MLPKDKMPEAELTLRLAISLFLNARNIHKNYTLNKQNTINISEKSKKSACSICVFTSKFE